MTDEQKSKLSRAARSAGLILLAFAAAYFVWWRFGGQP